jgi:predicted ATP-dependent endonuclease of OLD family
MKIKRVEIKNFRGIEHLELDFVDPAGNPLDLVVLAGPNGCGKTSVLEACKIVLEFHNYIERDNSYKQISKSNLRNGCDWGEISLNLDDNIKSILRKIEFNSRIMFPLNSPPEQDLEKIKELKIHYLSSWRWPKLVGSVDLTIGKKARKTKFTEDLRLSEIKKLLVNLTGRKAFENENLNDSELNEEIVFSKINNAWKFFYPDRDDYFKAEPKSEKIEEGFDIFLIQIKTGTHLPIDSLSSGEIEIFTMLGWFATHDYKDSIVFIDEPELHLHPSWHRAIMSALRTVLPNTQIICATHSVEILESVYSYERFTILPEDDPRIRMYNPPDINKDWK